MKKHKDDWDTWFADSISQGLAACDAREEELQQSLRQVQQRRNWLLVGMNGHGKAKRNTATRVGKKRGRPRKIAHGNNGVTREQIHAIVRRHPGISTTDVAKKLRASKHASVFQAMRHDPQLVKTLINPKNHRKGATWRLA